jgi:hypothetical protein
MSNRLFFLHIPKSAGTTFNYILSREVSFFSRYKIDGRKNVESIKKLKGYPEWRKNRLDVVNGHYPYGLHKLFTDKRCFSYIAFMRDPTSRIVSHYNYAKNSPEHYLYEKINNNKISLYDYISSPITHEVDNGQLRLLFGDDGNVEIGGCTDEMLNVVKETINQDFPVVGVSELYSKSILLFKDVYNFNGNVNFFSANQSKNPKEMDPKIVKLVRKKCKLEYELYDFVFDRLALQFDSYGITDESVKHFNIINSNWRDRFYYYDILRNKIKSFVNLMYKY